MSKQTRLVLLIISLVFASLITSGIEETTFAQPMPGQPGIERMLDHKPLTFPFANWIVNQDLALNPQGHPILKFRLWANQPKPVLPFFIVTLLWTVFVWRFFPAQLSEGRDCCYQAFWRTFLSGILAVLATIFFVRALFLSDIGTPLAFFLIALLELGLLLGLSISASLVGKRIMAWLPSGQTSFHWIWLVEVAIGVLVICLLLLVPGFGLLPRMGPRFYILFGILGFGGIIQAQYKRYHD